MHDTPRRLLLRMTVKLLFLIGIAASLYILFASTGEQRLIESALPPPLRISLAQTEGHNRFQRIPWQGGNLLLLHRTSAQLEQLSNHDEQLLDPGSVHARQPTNLPSPGRSLHPEIFIAFDRGTDLGCPLQWIAATTAVETPVQPWPGGFHDSCGGSWYDAAGRVFGGQAATRNLDIPTYRLDGDLLEIGAKGDNSALAN